MVARRKQRVQQEQVKVVEEKKPIESAQNQTIGEFTASIKEQIAELDYIVQGLKTHEPWLRAVKMFEQNKQVVDDNWHLVADPIKLQEFRITKMAADTLVYFVPRLEGDINKLRVELAKIENPNELMHKDYDGE